MTGGYFIGPGIGGQARLGGLMPRRIPEYLNYLWSESVPPGSPYSGDAHMAKREWTSEPGWSVVHPQLALAELAHWRPQAVIADARAGSPLGQYLANLLGPPSVQVDDLIGWRYPVLTGMPVRFSTGPAFSVRLLRAET